jgi:hypothetical protein
MQFERLRNAGTGHECPFESRARRLWPAAFQTTTQTKYIYTQFVCCVYMASLAAGGDVSSLSAVTAAAAVASISDMSPDIQAKYECVRSVGEECVSEAELKALLVKKVGEMGCTFNLYDGFEPSGRVHIAQGAFKANNVNKCTSSGGVFIFWVADW